MNRTPKKDEFPTTDSTSQKDDCQNNLLDHLQRALIQGLGVLRCYLTMISAEGERRGRRLLNHAMSMLLFTGIGVAGILFLAFGSAQWIESRLENPGMGALIVGTAFVIIFLVIALIRVIRKERNS